MKYIVEVVYALPDLLTRLEVKVDEKTTIKQAILDSGILTIHPEINIETDTIGVFSQRKKITDLLVEGDRIEIYRELIADPKEVRRKRALEQREKGIIK